MKSEAVAVAQSQERAALYGAVRDVMVNPLVIAVLGTVLIEYLQGHNDENGQHVAGGGWLGTAAGSSIEAALIANMAFMSVSEFAKQVEPVTKSLAPVIAGALVGA